MAGQGGGDRSRDDSATSVAPVTVRRGCTSDLGLVRGWPCLPAMGRHRTPWAAVGQAGVSLVWRWRGIDERAVAGVETEIGQRLYPPGCSRQFLRPSAGHRAEALGCSGN